MTAPEVTDFTARWYGSLPELYRVADALQNPPDGYPLLRYMSLIGDLAGAVEDIGERIDAGELTDPAIADPAWLDWLAQFVGVRLPPSEGTEVRRELIASAAAGWQSGTPAAIASAAKKALSGDAYCLVRPSTTADWTIQVQVLPEEAPSPLSLVAEAIIAAGAKPAGFALDVVSYSPGWDDVDALFDDNSWGSGDSKIDSWSAVDTTGAA